MRKIRGVYDGNHVRLLEPIHLQPDTLVEVWIIKDGDEEMSFRDRLAEMGLWKPVDTPVQPENSFEPVPITGPPISQTLIEER